MIIDIEHAFPTTVCINCWRRPIREGGVSRCEECAAEKEIQRMEKTTETEITPTHTHVFNYIGQGIETCVCGAVMWDNTQPHVIDESDPDIADYIKHNTKDLDPSEDWTGFYDPA